MNFIAPLARPSVDPRSRSRLIGATVGVLAAVALAAAAVPLGDPVTTSAPDPTTTSVAPAVAVPATTTPAAKAPTRTRPARTTVATTSGPAPAPDRTPTLDRIPASVGAGVAPIPPVPLRSTRPRSGSTLPRSEPTRVHIPAIGVDSDLVDLGLDDRGRMEVPRGAFPAGWYTGAPTPGELGPAILAGHVDYGGAAGVFFRLRELGPGDAVEVTREDGTTAVFRVTRVEQHDKDAFPTAAVYGDIDHAGLRLITCGGAFDRGASSYEDNIVVFAELDLG